MVLVLMMTMTMTNRIYRRRTQNVKAKPYAKKTHQWSSRQICLVLCRRLQLCGNIGISSKRLTGNLEVRCMGKSGEWNMLWRVKCRRLRRDSGGGGHTSRLQTGRELSLWNTRPRYRASRCSPGPASCWTQCAVLTNVLCSCHWITIICRADFHPAELTTAGCIKHCLLARYMWQTIACRLFHFYKHIPHTQITQIHRSVQFSPISSTVLREITQ